METMMTAFQ